ncbi:peptide ABC transporter substrate-binding protein [Paracoccus sp. Z118]|uniref:peptide ABC transporter substrate-binding protein n=1 Tax=Paracoccus sp. Z118 TaxID=2851017 RepID=UPI001C2B8DE2|nr:peptide ABC transporter substrate-binding protein [Paracoccus sp. Z118]MBV0892748.1 peptide ABC transporter substrate-binding protein [Paracoccus sp. Z118]
MKFGTLLLGAAAAVAMAPAAHAERGTDGQVNIIYSQAVSTMNAYLSSGTKDVEVGSLVLEPLAGFDETGALIPRLVTEIPTQENGGISGDMRTITWKIAPDLKWSDGSAFTAQDVVFTAEYCMHPEGGCAQLSRFEGVGSVEAVDPQTVRVTFTGPKANPYTAFVGARSPVLQKAQFQDCLGPAASGCTDRNAAPIGTGPFRVTEFRAGDVVHLDANPEYRDSARPAFATAMVKGGGDAAGAARAVMETGEYDYAWNTQLSPEGLAQMESGGKGQLVTEFGGLVERIHFNLTDPSPSLPEGERSSPQHPHPILADEKVRRALSMAIDRTMLNEIGYGAAGRPTCHLVPAPEGAVPDSAECLTQDIVGARALLDEAGWLVGGDGLREKGGRKLHLLFQTSANPVRHDFQALIKQWWSEIGVGTELKTIDGSVFFGGDAGSPDTVQRFHADVQMYAGSFDRTDPEAYLAQWVCGNIPGDETRWRGENVSRFCSEEYDALLAELGRTADTGQRNEIARRLSAMLTTDSVAVVPLIDRARVSAHSDTLGGVVMNVWDSELWNAAEWYRIQ